MATLGHGDKFEAGSATTGSTPALYATIRDEIIRAIQVGTYAPGSLLPSNTDIQRRWQVSNKTSRRVLTELAELGWARAEGRRGFIATAGPVPSGYDVEATGPDPEPAGTQVPNLVPPTYAPPRPAHTVPLSGPLPAQFTAVASVQAGTEPAPAEVAHALRLYHPGVPIHVRRRVITDTAGTVPLEIRTSYTIAVREDSAIAQAAPIPEPWPQALAIHTPHVITTAQSTVTARHPTAYEAATLRLPPHGIVLVRATTLHSELGPPIDHTLSVWPADTTTIHAADHPT
ncbi:GntR family transcriptional regulator [Actinomadura sp. 9N407]|uniref:GntR family transcriptional regulator n=1 Tax=Actinomadura sp. 9N407 TaxID=3375154 RepID=UPI0037AE6F97